MSDDLKLVIIGTFSVVALAWVATNASQLGGLTTQLAAGYGTAVGALKPSSN